MLRRLLGLETEYAIGVSPREGPTAPDNAEVYAAIREAIEDQVLTRPGDGSLQQFFVVNGGSFSYESLPWARGDGLVEGATPECRSPGTALLYQRAQDELLARALPAAERQLIRRGQPVHLSLRKNCCDAEGNVYGAQENYEAEVASGVELWAWRAGLALLMPLAFMSTLATWAVVVAAVVVAIVLLVPLGLVGLWSSRVSQMALYRELFGEPESHAFERRVGRPFATVERLLWEPTLRPFLWLTRALAFRRVRRDTLGFLLTRPILTGAGTLGPDGRFGLSEKGPAIRRLVRSNVAATQRPVWDAGNLCKSMIGLALLRGRGWMRLWTRRQRLQLGLSDSNVTQLAEYLKLGTTTLVLDMAEAGALADLPRLRRPVAALRAIIADPELRATVAWGHDDVRALEIQRQYWERARVFVQDAPTTSLEATEIVELWGRTLDALERDPASLVGRVDWVTKRFLLETAGDGEPWEVRKTIDLKLHQLGPGYLAELEASGLAPRLVSPEELEAALHEPPDDSPARRRSRLIRELADQDEEVRVYWDRVRVGGRLRGRVIHLADYRDPDEPEPTR